MLLCIWNGKQIPFTDYICILRFVQYTGPGTQGRFATCIHRWSDRLLVFISIIIRAISHQIIFVLANTLYLLFVIPYRTVGGSVIVGRLTMFFLCQQFVASGVCRQPPLHTNTRHEHFDELLVAKTIPAPAKGLILVNYNGNIITRYCFVVRGIPDHRYVFLTGQGR